MPINLLGDPVNRKGEILGCLRCPLNDTGVNKVKGLDRIKRRRAMLWAMAPGQEENRRKLELVGPAGDLLWRTLKKQGLEREDFDVQNVVRCRPVDDNGYNRDPSKRELQCCAVFNDEAMDRNAGEANVYLVMGDVAGEQLLGNAFKKDRPVFWHKPWNAYVVINYHPSYILRSGGEAAGWEYYTWRDRFKAVRVILDNPGRWGYVKSRDYRKVCTHAEFDSMEKALRTEMKEKRRVSFDIEDGIVDGKRVMLMGGFGTGYWENPKDWKSWKGTSYSVVVDHPQSGYTPTHTKEIKARLVKLIEDDGLKKSLQNGSYDKKASKDEIGAHLRGYDYDTQYGTYLRYSFLRACGLEPLTYRFFPEFGDYKDVVEEWSGNFADAPIDRLVLRNGGDCDITQRLEQKFSHQVPQALVKVYIHAGLTLDRMEKRGPLLDMESWKRANELVPKMIEKLDRQLRYISGDPNFDCDSPQQVAWLLYDHLGLPVPEEGRSTQKQILNILAAETENPTIELIQKRRALRVILSTFLRGYEKSAKLHDGELRTIWWLTGAVTGRLRSGKGDRAEAEGIVNFQNLHGNTLLQNLLVSDSRWRKAL